MPARFRVVPAGISNGVYLPSLLCYEDVQRGLGVG